MRKLSWERPIYVQKLDLLPPWLDMILGRAINTVCLDCGHQCMCTRCGACMTFCPICMQVRYHTTNALISYWIPLCHPFNKYTRNEHFSKVLHGFFGGGGGGLYQKAWKSYFVVIVDATVSIPKDIKAGHGRYRGGRHTILLSRGRFCEVLKFVKFSEVTGIEKSCIFPIPRLQWIWWMSAQDISDLVELRWC